MACKPASLGAGKQPETIAEASCQLLGGQHPQSRRGQFQGQWNAVEPVANLGNSRAVVAGQFEPRLRLSSAVQEESDGLILAQVLLGRWLAWPGEREGWHAPG